MDHTLENLVRQQTKQRALGAVIPHAGYVYSGHVAGAVFSTIEVPSRIVILCPNHTGFGPPLSIMTSGTWKTPLGDVRIDEELSSDLAGSDADLLDDVLAHQYEHAVEVMLPFIQFTAQPGASFVPIVVGTQSWSHLQRLGRAIAAVIRRSARPVLIIASSDMNHYESDGATRLKDGKAIERILSLDPRGLHDIVLREDISMCGAGPATAMLIAAKELSASKAELVRYATSGDVSGDFDRVVGYAGVVIR